MLLSLVVFAAAVLGARDARAVEISTVPAMGVIGSTVVATVGTIYTADRLRDPFARWGASRGPVRPFTLEDFNIHKLSLRGIMKDSSSDFALLSDPEFGVTFLLRKGKLYDAKNKAIPGIGGTINVKSKMVTLTAPEGDVQVFRLGEEDKE